MANKTSNIKTSKVKEWISFKRIKNLLLTLTTRFRHFVFRRFISKPEQLGGKWGSIDARACPCRGGGDLPDVREEKVENHGFTVHVLRLFWIFSRFFPRILN